MRIEEQIGEKLKALRKQRDLTQTAVGEVIGVSGSAVSNKENGNSDLTPTELKKLAKLFGVTVGWLFGEESEAGYSPDVQRLVRLYLDSTESGQSDILKRAVDAFLAKLTEEKLET